MCVCLFIYLFIHSCIDLSIYLFTLQKLNHRSTVISNIVQMLVRRIKPTCGHLESPRIHEKDIIFIQFVGRHLANCVFLYAMWHPRIISIRTCKTDMYIYIHITSLPVMISSYLQIQRTDLQETSMSYHIS